jgi:hypothetical protein
MLGLEGTSKITSEGVGLVWVGAEMVGAWTGRVVVTTGAFAVDVAAGVLLGAVG